MASSRLTETIGGLTEITDARQWDSLIQSSRLGHPLQLWAWGELKRLNGWEPHRLALVRGGATIAAGQLLFWRIPAWGKTVAYLPRGPVGEVSDARVFLAGAAAYARAHGALYLRIEPAWTSDDMRTAGLPSNWLRSPDGILLGDTYTLDLTKDEDELRAAMRGKTRQYIRKAEHSGISVERDTTGERLPDMWRIYQETATRADFGLHSFAYYQRLFELYGPRNGLYCAMVEGQAEAFLWLVEGGGVAFELYGGVTERGGARKANYPLKWRAIADMKRAGCSLYDFNGRLNEGVSQFKTGFGPDETEYAGTYDLPLDRLGYLAWRKLWPLAKPIGRKVLGARQSLTGA